MSIFVIIEMKSYRYLAVIVFAWATLINGASAQQFNYDFDSLQQVIRQHPDDSAGVRAYIDYAAKFFYSKSDSGLYYLDKGRALAQKCNNRYEYAYCLKNEGDLYAISGDFKKAALSYRQGILIAKRMQYSLLLTRMQSNLGIAYKNLGEMDSAIYTLNEVLVSLKDNVHTNDDSTMLAILYIQLFDVYRAQGLTEDALYYGELGYSLSAASNFSRGIGYGLYVEALRYSKDNPPLALDYCERALDIAVTKNIAELQVFARSLMADIYMDGKDYGRAEKELLQNMRYTAGSIQLVTQSKLSKVYYYLGDYPKALHFYQYAINLAYSLGYRAEIASTLENGMAIYQKLGDYRTAFELLKKYDTVKQQMASEKLKIDYERSSLRFKTAEKDKQLAQNRLVIEQKDNRLNRQSLLIAIITFISISFVIVAWIIYRQQRKLQVQRLKNLEASRELQMLGAVMSGEERERSRIAKDLHDGIGGILSAVKMRFSFFRTEFPGLKSSESFNKALEMLDDVSMEIRKTAHNLMPELLTRDGLDEALRVFCNNISLRDQFTVSYQSVGEIGRFNKRFELAVYRIVQELVNNVIKHSHAKNAYVQIARQGAIFTASIEDDGSGFNIENSKAAKGMGLGTVKDRIRSLGGEMEIDASGGNGTYIYFELDIVNFNLQSKAINEED